MRFLRELAGDIRYGGRLLRRSPGFTFVAGASLALGIAGAAAVFTLLNAIVLRPLPVSGARQLYLLQAQDRQDHGDLFSGPVFADAQREVAGRAELCAATGVTAMQVWPEGEPASSRGVVQLVSGDYFSVLRQRPALGRLLQPSDNVGTGAHPRAVISNAYWQSHYHGSPDVLTKTIGINGTTFAIVGVTRAGFFGTTVGVRDAEIWIPFTMQSQVRYASNMSDSGGDATKPWAPQRQIEWLNVFARVPVKADVSAVASAVSVVLQRDALTQSSPDAGDDARARERRVTLADASGGVSSLRDGTATPLTVLLAMVGVLLVIACGNVAGLLLARAAAREREVAIRLSIGAKRTRLVRQMLAESLLLGLGAGAIGLIAAVWMHDPLLRLFVPGTSVVDLDTGTDWRVLLFVSGVSIVAGIVCGVVPALRGTRVPLTDSLKQHSRTVGAGSGLFAGKTLVAAQMAFCLLLLVVAGLFARSLQSLARTDVGFDEGHLLVANLDVRSAGYPPEERIAMYQRLLERVRQVPGAQSASMSLNGPMNNSGWRSGMTVEGHTPVKGERLTTNEEIVVGPYFATVGLRLVDGRLFEPQDLRPGTTATIVNETFARRFFPGQSAIGKRWSYGDTIDQDAFTIIGVVTDARYRDLHAVPPTMAYHPAEFDVHEIVHDLEVQTAGPPAALVQSVRQAVTETEPRLPVTEIVPFSERVSRGLARDRMVAALSSAFGALALLLACLGLYGTISYGIGRRTGEIGLRMALGAERGSVLGMIMREALLLVVIGALVGLPLALLAARSIAALLYGVPPADLLSFGAATGVLLAVAAAAAFVPARRASHIAPIVALNR